MRLAILVGVLLLVVAAPALGQQSPGYNLIVNEFVPIEGEFQLCFEAPPGSLMLLLVSDGFGSVPTKYGTLCLQFPFWAIIPIVMPPTGSFCFPAIAHCDRVVPGLDVHLQFAALGPAADQVGLSNCTSLTFVEVGYCHPGEHVTFTQGAYGAACEGNNPACLLHAQFPAVFPAGLLMGDADGIDGDGEYALLLTSANAVQAFLPQGGARKPFEEDATDPTDSAAGVLAGQLSTAKLNVAFDDAGSLDVYKAFPTSVALGDMIFIDGVHPKLLGRRVRDVIDLADDAVSKAAVMPADVDEDGVGDVSFADLNVALMAFNENYDNGTADHHVLADPAP